MKPGHAEVSLDYGRRRLRTAGFTLIELLGTLVIAGIMAAIAVPVLSSAMASMRLNAAVSDFEGAISSARYKAIKDSQTYTFALTTPANTYVVTNTATGAVANPVPISNYAAFNGGTAATYTYTLCPNGMVYGAGGCLGAAPPALSVTYQGRQINISVSDVGNVTTTVVH